MLLNAIVWSSEPGPIVDYKEVPVDARLLMNRSDWDNVPHNAGGYRPLIYAAMLVVSS